MQSALGEALMRHPRKPASYQLRHTFSEAVRFISRQPAGNLEVFLAGLDAQPIANGNRGCNRELVNRLTLL